VLLQKIKAASNSFILHLNFFCQSLKYFWWSILHFKRPWNKWRSNFRYKFWHPATIAPHFRRRRSWVSQSSPHVWQSCLEIQLRTKMPPTWLSWRPHTLRLTTQLGASRIPTTRFCGPELNCQSWAVYDVDEERVSFRHARTLRGLMQCTLSLKSDQDTCRVRSKIGVVRLESKWIWKEPKEAIIGRWPSRTLQVQSKRVDLTSKELSPLRLNRSEALLSFCVTHYSNLLMLGHQALSAQSRL
jgi:hypothetical protein